ncbi:MAG: hypothetical protein FWG71_08050, partial [Synergistaceae bacterium]|nr:hypothetical protein [Synergistaceae bacterium]
ENDCAEIKILPASDDFVLKAGETSAPFTHMNLKIQSFGYWKGKVSLWAKHSCNKKYEKISEATSIGESYKIFPTWEYFYKGGFSDGPIDFQVKFDGEDDIRIRYTSDKDSWLKNIGLNVTPKETNS